MKKIGLLTRQITKKTIEDKLKESKGFFVVNYSGLAAIEMSLLRSNLCSINSNLFVAKNRVAKRILNKKDFSGLTDCIQGPCALVFFRDDPVKTAKAMVDFAKEHQNLTFSAGFIENAVLDKTQIKNLAHLPSREILLTQLVQNLNAPIVGLVYSLSGIINKFVLVLKEIEKTKNSNIAGDQK